MATKIVRGLNGAHRSIGPPARALAKYEARAGLIADDAQRAALRQLDALHDELRAYGSALSRWSQQLERWRAERERAEREAAEEEAARRRQPLAAARELAQRLSAWLAAKRAAPPAPPAPPARRADAALTAAEREHPFWRSGLGKAALDEMHADASSDLSPSPATPPSRAVRRPPPPPPPPAPPPPRGVFLHGEVGVGKTLVLDLFFDAVKESAAVPCLRRVHYNAFMLEVSSRLHRHSAAACERPAYAPRAEDEPAGGPAHRWHVLGELVEQLMREPPRARTDATSELIAELARDISEGGLGAMGAGEPRAAGSVPLALEAVGRSMAPGLLCFDEVQMMDVADASIVTGVLRRLVDAGWVIVATCNRSLEELGASTQHERHPQAAFSAVLRAACSPLRLASTAGDYREQLASGTRATDCASPFLHPLSADVDARLEATFEALAGGAGEPRELPVVFGRQLRVPAQRAGVARFSFAQLCEEPLGAADYVALADGFHTVVLSGVPRLSADRRDHARRFITMVDCLYNANSRLICSAEAPLRELFDFAAEGGGIDLEGLEFEAEGGKSDELGTLVGNTNAPVDSTPAPARVSADNRKALGSDAKFTGADERFAFRRALSRLLEMQSEPYARAARARVAGASRPAVAHGARTTELSGA